MDALLRLAASLGRFSAARRNGAARKYATVAACGVLAGVAGVAAVGFCLAALWFFVLPLVGPAIAAFILAGTLTVLCLILAATAVIVIRRDRQSAPRHKDDATAALTAVAHLFAEDKATMLLAALIAGATVGSSGGRAARSTDSDKDSRS